MSEAKHTKGPWVLKLSKGLYPYQVHAPNGNRGPGGIVDVTRWGAFCMPSSAEGQVNARLIAAAPELLDVLVSFTRSPYVKANHPKKYAAALAAIAKATGDSA
jgi:hypothetical protein